MAITNTGVVSVTTGGTIVTLDTPFTGTSYTLIWHCYDPTDPSASIGCTVDTALFATTHFHVVPYANGTFHYYAAEGVAGTVSPTGRLSRDYTVLKFWQEAVRDLGAETKALLDFEKYRLISRAVSSIAGAFYPQLSKAYKTEVSVTSSANKISLAGIRLGLSGEQVGLILESTGTTALGPVSEEEVSSFRSSAAQNLKRIVWAFSGDYLLLAKGSSLSTYGTLTLRYPRVPCVPTTDTEYVDLPDGLLMEMGLLKLKSLIALRVGERASPETEAQMQGMVKTLYGQLGIQASLEDIKTKTAAIL
jgi:hypothetical protein